MIEFRLTFGAALLTCAFALGACAAQVPGRQPDMTNSFSDGRFEVTWETGQTKKGSPLIAGYIKNTRGHGATNIRLRVDTLDAQGQVLATATGLVSGYVGGFGSTSFEVPLEKTGIGYRVSIIGWEAAGNGQ